MERLLTPNTCIACTQRSPFDAQVLNVPIQFGERLSAGQELIFDVCVCVRTIDNILWLAMSYLSMVSRERGMMQ